MRRLLLVLVPVVLLAACSAEPAPTTTTADPEVIVPPARVVEDWLAAVEAGDASAATSLADEVSLAVIIGAENPLSVADLVALVTVGVGETTGRSYWESFADDFSIFAGTAPGAIAAGGSEEFAVAEDEFAAVTVAAGEVESEIVCRRSEDGAWKVDLLATVGPALVRPLRRLVVELPQDADGEVVRSAIVSRVSSLQAGLERAPGAALPDAFRIELEALIGYLGSSR